MGKKRGKVEVVLDGVKDFEQPKLDGKYGAMMTCLFAGMNPCCVQGYPSNCAFSLVPRYAC